MKKEFLKQMHQIAATLMKNNFDILTGRTQRHLVNLDGFLIHEQAQTSFLRLQELAKHEINAELQIISSFRSFEHQARIWNEKASGKRPVKDDSGKVLSLDELLPIERLRAIMRFSALPGNSRHHWGTDLDIFDAREQERKSVKLEAWECEKGGPFYRLHQWLDEKIAAKNSFGFYRPYDRDLGGVSIEKWHLSYVPTAEEYFNSYGLELFKQNISQSEIAMKPLILEHLETIFEQYFLNIGLA